MCDRLIAYGGTDVGKVRARNEDTYLIDGELGLFVVADGMGGHRRGDIASSMAVAAVRAALARERDLAERATGLLSAAVLGANAEIHARSAKDPDLEGMGTTVTSALIANGRIVIAHVGDSRAYCMRDGKLECLSVDHTLVGELVRSGMMTPDVARTSHLRHVLSRSLGAQETVAVDVLSRPCRPGDVYILASDGLTAVVDDTELAALVQDNFLRDIPRALIDLALGRGAPDNITVVIVAVVPCDDD